MDGKLCKKCVLGCTSCSAVNKCITCADEYYLDSTKACLACEYPCLLCMTKTLCHSCEFGPENRLRVPNCICSTEFSDSLNQFNGCITCISPCKTCSEPTKCTSCID